MAKCEGFTPFPPHPDVCDNCGETVMEHGGQAVPNVATEFREDLWKVMFKYGCVPSFYGGHDTHEMIEVKVHLGVDLSGEELRTLTRINSDTWGWKRIEIPAKPCRIDYGRTQDPKMDTYAEFAGTECDAGQIPALVGELHCVCRKVSYQDWVLKDKTMGQLMWLVVKEAEARD